MYVVIWEFMVLDEQVLPFTKAYGPDGEWVRLFRRAEGYIGTQLLQSAEDVTTFLTIDQWDDVQSFNRFCDEFGSDYKELDNSLERLTRTEKKIGSFSKQCLEA